VADDLGFGSADDLLRHNAVVHEHGQILMLRYLGPAEDEPAVEAITAEFGAENGSPGARLDIDQSRFLLQLDDLEVALSNPASATDRDCALPLQGGLSREACSQIPGAVFMVRYAREIEEEELFEPAPARFVENRPGALDLLLLGERYLFRPQDFWRALTDPKTYRPERYGPDPIDVLRSPIGF
jgi:hypothetical protein